MNLDRNPVTGLLAKLTNEEDVKAAVFNLLMTSNGERFYQPDVGSKIRAILFDPIDPVNTNLLETTITYTINNFEPRVTLQQVNVVPDPDNNLYTVTIVCSLINIPQSNFAFQIPLKRIR